MRAGKIFWCSSSKCPFNKGVIRTKQRKTILDTTRVEYYYVYKARHGYGGKNGQFVLQFKVQGGGMPIGKRDIDR